MKYLSLSLAIFGLLTLLFLLLLQPSSQISSISALANIDDNKKITLTGTLTHDIPLNKEKGRQITLYSNNSYFTLSCLSCPPMAKFRGLQVSIIAYPEKFRNRTYLYVLEISTINLNKSKF